MVTFTFDEIPFIAHTSGDGGFEATVVFDNNNFQCKVVCGPTSFRSVEPELYTTPAEYQQFDYWLAKPIDYLPPTPENWIGPVTREQLVAALTEFANLPWVEGWQPGGTGLPE